VAGILWAQRTACRMCAAFTRLATKIKNINLETQDDKNDHTDGGVRSKLEDVIGTASDVQDEDGPRQQQSVDVLLVHVEVLSVVALLNYLGHEVEVGKNEEDVV